MKKALGCMVMLAAAVVFVSFSNKMIGKTVMIPTGDSVRADVAERQENDFLREVKSDAYAYEFTKGGDYRFIVTEVQTPIFEFMNFCLDGSAAGLIFEDQRIICPDVKNELRCITGLRQNLASNEYIVKGIKAGATIRVWPSNPYIVLKPSGIHCTNNKFNCNLYGPQAEWEGNGYKIKVMVLRYKQ